MYSNTYVQGHAFLGGSPMVEDVKDPVVLNVFFIYVFREWFGESGEGQKSYKHIGILLVSICLITRTNNFQVVFSCTC